MPIQGLLFSLLKAPPPFPQPSSHWALLPFLHPLLWCTWGRPGTPLDSLLPSPRSSGPAAGAGRRAWQVPTGSSAEDSRSQMAGKAVSTGCRGVGPGRDCPAGVTWSDCTRCRPWWRCLTMAGSCRAGCGPGGSSCAGWNRGSGLLEQSPGAGCSPCSSVKEDSDSPAQLPRGGTVSTVTMGAACRQHATLAGGQEPAQPLQGWKASSDGGGSAAQNNAGQSLGTRDLLGEAPGTWTPRLRLDRTGCWGRGLAEQVFLVLPYAQSSEWQGPVPVMRRGQQS